MSTSKDAGNKTGDLSGTNNIRTIVRLRPGLASNEDACLIPLAGNSLQYRTGSGQGSMFVYDSVLAEATEQEEVFSRVSSIVNSTLSGRNGTIMTYGQTGGGKTHTLIGDVLDPVQKGIIPRTAAAIFEHIKQQANTGLEAKHFIVQVSAVEIYCERIRDLLCLSQASDNLTVQQEKEKGMVIAGAKLVGVSSEGELLRVVQEALGNRVVASTGMNAASSRSHCLVFLHLQQYPASEPWRRVTGKLCLVDLAGSERQERTLAKGVTLEEGKLINKGLSALSNVVSALLDPKRSAGHIPYRDSKLTRVLQDSLGGKSFTALIVCCSPSPEDAAESLASLRFASRAAGVTSLAQAEASPCERISPEAARQLHMRLEEALAENATLKAENSLVLASTVNFTDLDALSLQRAKQSGGETATDKESLCKSICATVHALWFMSVMWIAIIDILLK